MYKNSITVTLLALTLLISGCDKKSDSSSNGDDTPPEKEIVVKKQPTLVVMLQYSAPVFTENKDDIKTKIFGTKSNSVNDYYKEVSNGQFILEAVEDKGKVKDGVVKIVLGDPYPNVAADPKDDYKRTSPGIKKAIEEISADGFDFSVYDTNDDGKISAKELTLVFVVAGAESATLDLSASNNPDSIGALTTYLDDSFVPTVNGVTLMNKDIGNYFVMGERHYIAGKGVPATIGVIVHELGHAVFDLPDLYDTNNSMNGIGSYGLMGMGEWNLADSSQHPGETPAHLSAWSKIKVGFITPETHKVTDSEEITLYATGTDKYNIVKIEVTKNEYFLIENRGSTGYDRGLGADSTNTPSKGGLAIWHIDDSIKTNDDSSHKLVDLEEADGLESINNKDIDDDLPSTLLYGVSVTEFTPTTTPNSNLYDGTDSKVYITNISTVGSKMTIKIGK